MQQIDHRFCEMLQVTLECPPRSDRTGTGTRSLFGGRYAVDISASFPLLQIKALHVPGIVHELLWFLKGDTNVRYLQQNGVKIWNEWADENGDLGPVYGHQWRSWQGADGKVHDQISAVIEEIRTNPTSRRLVVSAWNVGDLPKMALAPCHCLFQFYVRDGFLDCQLYQRSGDAFLGVPFNVASYALLTSMVAAQCNLFPGLFVHTFGDLHLYENHTKQAEKAINRSRRAPNLPRVQLWLNPEVKSIFDYKFEDIRFEGYKPLGAIKAPVSV